MAIWQRVDGSWITHPWHRKQLGLDVYLCCPGPSLATVDPNALKVPGAYIVAMNTAYPKIRPDLWIGMDRPPCYAPSLMHEAFPKLMRGGSQNLIWNNRRLHEYPQTFFVDVEDDSTASIVNRLNPGSKMAWRKNTFFVALNTLMWMGAKRIHLVGCDFGGSKDYFDDRTLTDSHRKRNRRLYANILGELKPLVSDLKHLGIEIISCTEGSPANAFLKYVPLKEALAASAANVNTDAPVLASPDAEVCTWNHKTTQDEGVIVLADSRVEWMLPWWYSRYRRHNAKPVQFVDNGMTAAGVRFCKAFGQYVDVRKRSADMTPLPGWYAKPAAVLTSQFKKTVYLDIDCEVLGNIDEIFEFAGHGAYIHRDIPWEHTEAFKSHFKSEEYAYNSGVIAVKHGHPLIERWASLISSYPNKYCGDQDYLTELAREKHIEFLPSHLNNLRLDMRCSAAVIRHWTGPQGKDYIRGETRCERHLDFTDHSKELVSRLIGRGPLTVAEIGVFHGRTSSFMLAMLPDIRMYLVDSWKAFEPDHRYVLSGDETAKYTQEQMDNALKYVARITAFAASRRTVINKLSLAAADDCPGASLDLCFLDADHTYEAVCEDISAWWPKVKPGGWLCGHDLDNQPPAGKLWGVREALNEFTEATGLPYSKGAGYTWFIQKPCQI